MGEVCTLTTSRLFETCCLHALLLDAAPFPWYSHPHYQGCVPHDSIISQKDRRLPKIPERYEGHE